MAEAWDDYRFEPNEVIEAGDNIVVVGRETGRERGTDKRIDHEIAAVWTVRNGKAVRYRLYADITQVSKAVDPVVQVLVLVDIVVEATVTALLLALAVQAHKRFGSVNPHDLRALRD